MTQMLTFRKDKNTSLEVLPRVHAAGALDVLLSNYVSTIFACLS